MASSYTFCPSISVPVNNFGMGKGNERIKFAAVDAGLLSSRMPQPLSNKAELAIIESFKNSRRETGRGVLVVVLDLLFSILILLLRILRAGTVQSAQIISATLILIEIM